VVPPCLVVVRQSVALFDGPFATGKWVGWLSSGDVAVVLDPLNDCTSELPSSFMKRVLVPGRGMFWSMGDVLFEHTEVA
jgi:hypothetical protein